MMKAIERTLALYNRHESEIKAILFILAAWGMLAFVKWVVTTGESRIATHRALLQSCLRGESDACITCATDCGELSDREEARRRIPLRTEEAAK